jgi:hypothetical protein
MDFAYLARLPFTLVDPSQAPYASRTFVLPAVSTEQESKKGLLPRQTLFRSNEACHCRTQRL